MYLIKVVKNAWKITSVSDQKPRKEPQTTPKESRREDNWARKGSSQQPAEHDLVFRQEKCYLKGLWQSNMDRKLSIQGQGQKPHYKTGLMRSLPP